MIQGRGVFLDLWLFKLGFIEETEVKFCRDRRPRRSTPQGFGDHKPSVNGPSRTPVPTRRVPHGGCSVSTNTPTNPNLNISNSPTFKFGFIGEFIFGGVASLAPSGRGLPRSGWRSPAARRIKARKIAIFLGHAEIISSKIASSRGLPQSPSAPAPSRREPYNSTSNSPINPNLKHSPRLPAINLTF